MSIFDMIYFDRLEKEREEELKKQECKCDCSCECCNSKKKDEAFYGYNDGPTTSRGPW